MRLGLTATTPLVGGGIGLETQGGCSVLVWVGGLDELLQGGSAVAAGAQAVVFSFACWNGRPPPAPPVQPW